MYYEVAKQLMLTCPLATTIYEHSQPAAAQGTVNVTVEATVYDCNEAINTSFELGLQESNDLEKWVESSLDAISLTASPSVDRVFGVGGVPMSVNARYARLRYEIVGAGAARALVAASLDVSRA